jgi:hypothetical protein
MEDKETIRKSTLVASRAIVDHPGADKEVDVAALATATAPVDKVLVTGVIRNENRTADDGDGFDVLVAGTPVGQGLSTGVEELTVAMAALGGEKKTHEEQKVA